jgi:hypothetical protein
MQRACHGLTLGVFAACLMRVDDASVCAGLRDGGNAAGSRRNRVEWGIGQEEAAHGKLVETVHNRRARKVTEGRKRQPFSDKASPRRSLTSHHRRELHILHQVLSKKRSQWIIAHGRCASFGRAPATARRSARRRYHGTVTGRPSRETFETSAAFLYFIGPA